MTNDNGIFVRSRPALQEIKEKRLARGDKEEEGMLIKMETYEGYNISAFVFEREWKKAMEKAAKFAEKEKKKGANRKWN